MCFLDLSMKHFCLIPPPSPPMLDEVLHSYSNLHPTLNNQQILKTFFVENISFKNLLLLT